MLFPLAAGGAAVLVDPAAVAYHSNGIPFTADGYVAIGPGPITHYSQGLPFNAAGQLVTQAPPTP